MAGPRQLWWLFVCSLAGGSACSLFSGLDQLEVSVNRLGDAGSRGSGGPSPPSSTVADVDSPPPSDASSRAPDGGGEAGGGASIVHDTFESNAQCDGWDLEEASGAPEAPGYASSRACKVCGTGVGADGSIHKYLPIDAGDYVFRAWFRAVPGEGPTNVIAGAYNPATDDDLGQKVVPLPPDVWTLVEVPFRTSVPIQLELYLEGFEGNRCILVDETVLEKTSRP